MKEENERERERGGEGSGGSWPRVCGTCHTPCSRYNCNIELHIVSLFLTRADVIVVCFSVVRPHSLRSVLSHWYPEIQRISPGVPIILCGTQIDLRYLYTEEEFLKIDKGPFFRFEENTHFHLQLYLNMKFAYILIHANEEDMM